MKMKKLRVVRRKDVCKFSDGCCILNLYKEFLECGGGPSEREMCPVWKSGVNLVVGGESQTPNNYIEGEDYHLG